MLNTVFRKQFDVQSTCTCTADSKDLKMLLLMPHLHVHVWLSTSNTRLCKYSMIFLAIVKHSDLVLFRLLCKYLPVFILRNLLIVLDTLG